MCMRPIDRVFALWKIGVLSPEEAVAWADQEIRRSDTPSQELFDLSLDGPEKCLRKPAYEFCAVESSLTYSTELAVRAVCTPLDTDEQILDFCRWCARAVIGEELEQPGVSFGYRLDHLICDCRDVDAAVQLAKSELPEIFPTLAGLAAPFLELLAVIRPPVSGPIAPPSIGTSR